MGSPFRVLGHRDSSTPRLARWGAHERGFEAQREIARNSTISDLMRDLKVDAVPHGCTCSSIGQRYQRPDSLSEYFCTFHGLSLIDPLSLQSMSKPHLRDPEIAREAGSIGRSVEMESVVVSAAAKSQNRL